MTITVYGIPNCDTVRKARAWLKERGIAAEFHDFKKAGLTADMLQRWSAELGWEALVNRRGTTWRRLDEASRASADHEAGALALMVAQPSLIKRPVVDWHGRFTVGFDPASWPPR